LRIGAVVACVGAGVITLSTAAPAPAATVSTWSIVPSANVQPSPDSGLLSVSCGGPRSCTAVGFYAGASADQSLAESWNGSGWSIVPSPNTAATDDNELESVACASPTSCVAVGFYYDGVRDRTLAMSWDGSTWTLDTTVNPSATSENAFGGVSCTAPTSCIAVGHYRDSGNSDQTLVESWDGRVWSVVPSPSTSSTVDNFLNGVSCSASTSCVAVGSYDGATNSQTLAEVWNGVTWSIVASPNLSSNFENILNNVSCTTASFCMAVGSEDTAASPPSLIEMWNGTTWSIVSSPATSIPNSDENVLYGVSCTGPSNCVATGHWSNTGDVTDQTLIEQWDGSAWSIVPSPNTSAVLANDLEGVSCGGGSLCMTVGSQQTSGPGQTLTLLAPIQASGYYEVASDGGLFAFHAPFLGSMGGHQLNAPIVGMAVDPATGGYWEVAADGGIFSFNAPFFGSMGGTHLNKPIVGMAYDPATGGYWEVASDGGIFAFNAPFLGSTGNIVLNKPVVGMAALPDGTGYYEVASDGGLFAFHAPFLGSMGGTPLNKPVVGMALDLATGGYWEVAADGGLFAFGAPFLGSMGGKPLNKPVVGMAAQPDGSGYWEAASDGGLFSFNAPFFGSAGNLVLNTPVVGLATS
jgi:hypothetical protein